MIRIHTQEQENLWFEAQKKLFSALLTAKNKKILLLLSGGSVVKMYGKLSEFLKDFSGNIALGQVDERFQPSSNDDINANGIQKAGIKLDFVISQEGTLEESAKDYDGVMEKAFLEYTYKIAILGVGEDGHTAGLLPGYGKDWDSNNFAVGYRNNGTFTQRITITPKAIRELDYGLVVSTGESKRAALGRILNHTKDALVDRTPGILLHEIDAVDLFTNLH